MFDSCRNLEPLLTAIAFAGSSHVHISTCWRHETSKIGICPSLCMCRSPQCLNLIEYALKHRTLTQSHLTSLWSSPPSSYRTMSGKSDGLTFPTSPGNVSTRPRLSSLSEDSECSWRLLCIPMHPMPEIPELQMASILGHVRPWNTKRNRCGGNHSFGWADSAYRALNPENIKCLCVVVEISPVCCVYSREFSERTLLDGNFLNLAALHQFYILLDLLFPIFSVVKAFEDRRGLWCHSLRVSGVAQCCT